MPMTRIIGLRPVVWVRGNRGNLMSMHEIICKNCGKHEIIPTHNSHTDRVFCNKQCQREWWEKQRLAKKAKAAENDPSRKILSWPKTPEEQCKRCEYGMYIGGVWCCGHFEIAGHTRNKLHPEGLPEECQEFMKKKRKRKTTSKKIL